MSGVPEYPSHALQTMPPLTFTRVNYAKLNSRQQENYNFARVSALLSEYGFTTLRLSDDWQGADFIATHISGAPFLKVQLKSRLWVDTKYKGKEIWLCFPHKGTWYLYPHDDLLAWALANTGIGRTQGWKDPNDLSRVQGAYSWPGVPSKVAHWLAPFAIPPAL